MGGLVRLVSAKMSQKGSCRKCFQSRETGDHTKCDRVRPELTYTGNTVDTTVADLRKFVDALPEKHHIFFRVQIAGMIEPLLEGRKRAVRPEAEKGINGKG